MDKGMPSSTAREAAKEKFKTVVIEMTVDAKQRFRDFSTADIGATL